MVNMVEILRLIDERVEALKLEDPSVTDTSVSKKATNSTDTIRNWRRALRKNQKTGATITKLKAVGDVLGIDLTFGQEQPTLYDEAEIKATLQRIDGLTRGDVAVLMKVISSARTENASAQAQSDSRDQSEMTTRPRG